MKLKIKIIPVLFLSVRQILFTTVIATNISHAQQNDNLNYFPYHNGDMWEYYYSDGPYYQDTAQVFNHYDSTDAAGNIYVTQTSRYINPISVPAIPFADTMRYKIDTLNQVWGRVGELDSVIAFKLNAQQGDQWILKTYYDNGEVMGYEMARIRTIYQKKIFDQYYFVMNTYYYETQDTTDTLGLVRYEVELAKGLGKVWQGGGESPGRMDIKGVVIGGILYGDTTNIITSVRGNNLNIFPSTFELKQNYPNPFNPITTIKYKLQKTGFVSLKVYDMLGKEIVTLLNENKKAGSYSIQFDGSNLASGVYYYSLTAGSKRITKSMILLK